jgi:hypothetical protein
MSVCRENENVNFSGDNSGEPRGRKDIAIPPGRIQCSIVVITGLGRRALAQQALEGLAREKRRTDING